MIHILLKIEHKNLVVADMHLILFYAKLIPNYNLILPHSDLSLNAYKEKTIILKSYEIDECSGKLEKEYCKTEHGSSREHLETLEGSRTVKGQIFMSIILYN